MNSSQGHSGTKVQCESCFFSKGKTPECTKMGEIHELLVLALSLVWFAGATPDKRIFISIMAFQPQTSKSLSSLLRASGQPERRALRRKLASRTDVVTQVLNIAVRALLSLFGQTKLSSVRTSIRDISPTQKCLVRKSGVGGDLQFKS